MLNKRERYKVLEILRICSNFGPFPIQVDLANGQLTRASKRKQWICGISYSFFALHVLLKNITLAYAYFFVPDTPLHQLVIHTIMAVGTVMLVFWYYVLFLPSPALFTAWVKITLLGNVGGPLDPSDRTKKERTTRLKEYSLQDLIAVTLPYTITAAAGLIVASYIYDPSMRLLLYTALPTLLQNWATFGLCLLEEIRYIVFCMVLVIPIWQLQVTSFDLVSNQLQLLAKTIQKGRQSGRSVYRHLRCLQLYVSTFNNVNSYLIFTWKLVSISLSVGSGYAAIAHFQKHPVMGCMYYAILFDCVTVYAVIYEKAFKIPQLFNEAAASAMLHLHGSRMTRNGLFVRQIKSIPPTGIKVGHFHTMERASTLIFMDFVLVNIVNMLVAYG